MNNYSFNVIAFANKQFYPHTVERLVNKEFDETFAIGDMITNEHGMRGKITRFKLDEDLKTIYVYTDWSGIGFNLAAANKVILLPSRCQVNDQIYFTINEQPIEGNVRGVHFYESKVKYDLELKTDIISRIYNVDSVFVSPVKE
jgi:hypothetical protein